MHQFLELCIREQVNPPHLHINQRAFIIFFSGALLQLFVVIISPPLKELHKRRSIFIKTVPASFFPAVFLYVSLQKLEMENRVEKKKVKKFWKDEEFRLVPSWDKDWMIILSKILKASLQESLFRKFFVYYEALLSFNSLRLRQFMKKHEIEKKIFFRETLSSTLPLLKIQKFFCWRDCLHDCQIPTESLVTKTF